MTAGSDASRWLPKEWADAGVARREPPPTESESDAWRSPPDASSDPAPEPGAEEGGAGRDELRALGDEVRAISAAAQGLSERVAALERTVAERPAVDETGDALAQQLDRIEAATRRLADRVDRIEAGSEAAPNPAQHGMPASESGDRDINRMSFEDLRGLGLSVNQAARLISQRDTRGGFDSLDDLNTLYGFPREQLEGLKQAVTIQSE